MLVSSVVLFYHVNKYITLIIVAGADPGPPALGRLVEGDPDMCRSILYCIFMLMIYNYNTQTVSTCSYVIYQLPCYRGLT